ncbi:hypothetical protein KBC51_03265 [Candidatus Saccharibacteria bacterium]|nr:hypothetical protein [Candidatus Saccharibacteria bacterium]
MLGPLDYIAVSFKGNNFDGSVLEELVKASESGAIRVVDLAFVIKEADGAVVMAEVKDQSEELLEVARKLGFTDEMPLITEDDIAKIGDKMDNDSAVGLLVIEQLWAKGLKAALINLGAELIDEGRIHPEAAEAALEEISQQ